MMEEHKSTRALEHKEKDNRRNTHDAIRNTSDPRFRGDKRANFMPICGLRSLRACGHESGAAIFLSLWPRPGGHAHE